MAKSGSSTGANATKKTRHPKSRKSQPLADKSVLVITDGKPGMEVQCAGVAKALGTTPRIVRVAPRWLWRLMAPWGPADPRDRMRPPWPDIAIATGRQSIPYLRALSRQAGDRTYTVVIQNPKTGSGTADLICVPKHDRMSGDNVITTLTSPHTFPPAELAKQRKTLPSAITSLPSPRVTVILGGPNAAYNFSDSDIAELAGSVAALAKLGVSFLITPSRRTPPALFDAVASACGDAPLLVWTGSGEVSYEQLLAAGDHFVVTADSVNMTGEACATGQPVYVFKPSGGSPKFAWFHEALRQYGATRNLPDDINALEKWSYDPLDAAATIARQIEQRWLERH